MSVMHPYDTIVIGLGCAGVTAATTLAKAGKQVLALERHHKVGGRVNTFVNSNHDVTELGAEWIHGTNNIIYAIAKQHNILLLPQTITRQVLWSDGSVADESIIKATQFFYPTEVGRTVDNDDPYISWHRYGYKTFFEIMLNTYNNGPGLPNLDIIFMTGVLKINWPKDDTGNVEVICTDGNIYTAKNVIVTIPIGQLKQNHAKLFNPPLPDKKIQAINSISVGTVNKLVIKFNEPWWPKQPLFFNFLWKPEDKAKVSTTDAWMTHIFGASSPAGCRKSLILWVRGDGAKMIETLPEHILRKKCMELLTRFMGKTSTIVQQPWILNSSNWYSNVYGSYSYENIQSTARSDLAEPLMDSYGNLRVLFAGEATHSTYFSSTHGATETGIREAKRLVPDLKLDI